MRPYRSGPIACYMGMLLTLAAHTAFAADLTIFDEANINYMRQYGDNGSVSFGASSALARQIESGAPANIVISADLDWTDYLEKRNLIQTGSRKNLLGNRLVIAAPADTDIKLNIATDVAADTGVKVVGVFPPETHPPIVYPIALTAENRDVAAKRLLDFLLSAAAKPIFQKHGFTAAGE